MRWHLTHVSFIHALNHCSGNTSTFYIHSVNTINYVWRREWAGIHSLIMSCSLLQRGSHKIIDLLLLLVVLAGMQTGMFALSMVDMPQIVQGTALKHLQLQRKSPLSSYPISSFHSLQCLTTYWYCN